jgi:hypothetical protein
MKNGFTNLLQIFPTPDMNKTAEFYTRLGFNAVFYLESSEPHVCLYRDSIELILTKSNKEKVVPNRAQHGYGYDGYFITDEQEEFQREMLDLGIKIARALSTTDYSNNEFVFEDCDGRWIAVGKKI